ncbi:9022_t:CDS:2 [Entrophospora sp. SA101]|nr:9279_t:CDS:2 [Entrophospora sp. SA101]CAJ0825609.1 9022_t:CDS:2 [Entrophospora sp. SA101]
MNSLARKYFEIIQLSYSFAAKNEIEMKCWKLGFYLLIEQFRYAIKEENNSHSRNNPSLLNDVAINQFSIFLNEAEIFYKNLLKQIADESKQNEINKTCEKGEKNKPPKWIRCVSCLGDITRYRFTYGLEDHEHNKSYWADKSSRWYRLGIQLNSNNGKFYHHLAILSGQNELKTLYYYCRSLIVKTPFMTARESLVTLFEANRKCFATFTINGNNASGGHSNNNNNIHIKKNRRGYLQREINNNDNKSTMKSNSQANQVANQSIDMINISSLYNYGNYENSSLGKALRLQKGSANIDDCLSVDPAFSEEVKLTFNIMKQFMTKYLDFELVPKSNGNYNNELTEGWLIYCEVVMLWMISSDAFNNFNNHNIDNDYGYDYYEKETNKSIWENLIGKSICPNFWDTFSTFLTRIVNQVSPFTRDDILNNISKNDDSDDDSIINDNKINKLLPPPLSEDWELRGISWLQTLYESYSFESSIRSNYKFANSDVEDIIYYIYNINHSLELDPDSKSRRRTRIVELGFLLTKLKYLNTIGDNGHEATKEFYDDQNQSNGPRKSFDWFEEVNNKLSDEGDDEIKELKTRRQELENMLATKYKGTLNNSQQQKSTTQKKTASSLLSKIVPGFTTLVVDTNCLVGDLNLVKKIIQSDNWTVVVPLVVVTELDGLKYNSSPLVQTSKGNYLTSIDFSEEFDFGDGEDKKRNLDDLILGICLWHSTNIDRKSLFDSNNGTGNNNSEIVVLVTNDRNLRVKARARGVDVVGVQDLYKLI